MSVLKKGSTIARLTIIFSGFRKKSKCAVWISRSMESQLILLLLMDMVGIEMKKIKVNFDIKLFIS